MRPDWHRQHRWSSLAVAFFLIMFCISGILLNHRDAIAGCEVSRSLLPPFYRYDSWNLGLLRGTVALPEQGSVAVYGSGGIFLADSCGRRFDDFSAGLPAPAHYRNIRAMAMAPDSSLYALAATGLYRRVAADSVWRPVIIPQARKEAFTDMVIFGDSIAVMTRSHIYVSALGAHAFSPVTLPPPAGGMPGSTLFRYMWDFHSGRMFGTAGILIADILGLTIVFLCGGGLVLWLLPRYVRRRRRRGLGVPKRVAGALKFFFITHRKVGLYSLLFVALISISGWCLRPPVLVGLVSVHTPSSASANVWEDKLRMLRYDENAAAWLLSATSGFYRMERLGAVPEAFDVQPPVSVMGLNVLEPRAEGRWLCGSFSGAYLWSPDSATVTDYLSGAPADLWPGPPFGKTAVAGYSADFAGGPFIVTYDHGTDRLPMPGRLSTLPMPLWNVALEVHTGRIYLGNAATWFFVFIAGLLLFWCLLSGFMVARRRKN